MTQLKKIFLGAAVAAMGFIGVNSANAQVVCSASASPVIVRTQGLTEPVGSVSLNCLSGTPAAPTTIGVGSYTLSVSIQPPTAVITNPPIGTPAVTGLTTTAVVASGINITNSGTATITSITLVGNTLTASFTAVAGSTLGAITVSGMRVNASASGVSFPNSIQALVTTGSPTAITISGQNPSGVAYPQSAFVATTSAGAGLPQCASATFAGLADAPSTIPITAIPQAGTWATGGATLAGKAIGTGGTTAKVTVAEGYATSMLQASDEGQTLLATNVVTSGTRVTVSVTGLPSNTVMYAAEKIVNSAPGFANGGTWALQLVSNAGVDGSGGSLTTGAVTTADLIAGTSVTYEVTGADAANVDASVIAIQFYTTGTPAPIGTVSLSVSLAPTSTVTGSAGGTPIPRFAPAGSVSGTATNIIPCVTNIFFPYVSNEFGFETGIAIANSTLDPFGTAGQPGTCTFNLYGKNAPTGGTFGPTSVITPGTTTALTLSSMGVKDFSGYIIAQCGFQLGHGFQFMISGGLGVSGTVGMGGPGLIILQPGTTSSSSRKGLAAVGPPFGEALGN